MLFRSLKSPATIQGFGVHGNAPATIVLHPADVNSGVVFLRTGLPGGRERLIEAKWGNVVATELCTVVGDGSGARIATIEHLMAALSGLQVDNVLVEIDGPEMPIMDGSAAQFVAAIDEVGLAEQSRPRRYIKIVKPVRVEHGGGFAEWTPAERGFKVDVEIDFQARAIGRQRRTFDLDPTVFRRDICRARTFGFLADVKKLWKAGFALGSSLENSVALEGDDVLNPEGLRYGDEFVRHKALDAIGDLALAGAPFIGNYRSYRPGHTINAKALAALLEDRRAYEFVEVVSRRAFGSLSPRLAAAAFAPPSV